MTKAQTSFLKAIPAILQDLEFNATDQERNILVGLLSNVTNKTIWGLGINKVFDTGNSKQIDDLIEQLSQQASEDTLTMSKIVGWDATLILLRIYTEKANSFFKIEDESVAIK